MGTSATRVEIAENYTAFSAVEVPFHQQKTRVLSKPLLSSLKCILVQEKPAPLEEECGKDAISHPWCEYLRKHSFNKFELSPFLSEKSNTN